MSIKIKKIDIMAAGIVSTYFQLASHKMCMKNKITNSALVHETAIMSIRLSAGVKLAAPPVEISAKRKRGQKTQRQEHVDVVPRGRHMYIMTMCAVMVFLLIAVNAVRFHNRPMG